MGRRLADQDEVKSPVQRVAAEQFMAVQIVAQEGDAQRTIVAPAVSQPALGRVEFTILLLRAVLRWNKFRGQRDHFVQPRVHQHRSQGGMAIRHRAVGVVPGRAIRAMDRVRGKILRSIEGQQQGLVHRAVGLHHASLV